MVFASYFVNIAAFIAVFLNYIGVNRCFVRESGARYSKHMGLEFTHSFMEKISCYFYWSFTSWLVLFLVLAAAMFVYLRSQDASPFKIFFVFITIDVALVFIGSLVTISDGHSRLTGGAL